MRLVSAWRAAVVVAVLVSVPPLTTQPAQAAETGGVLGWGRDSFGQVGDGGGALLAMPSPVAVDGLGPGSGVVAAAGGGNFSLALHADGRVLAWGADFSGELGNGPGTADQTAPVAVSGLGAGSGVVALSAGYAHGLALGGDGRVLAWGDDGVGQLGDGGTAEDRSSPVAVSGLGPGSGVVAVAAGSEHSLALLADGTVLAWGSDSLGQLGDGGGREQMLVPVAVSGLGPGSGVVAVAAGSTHSVALRGDGSVLTWGGNGNGALGTGSSFNGDFQPAPVPVPALGPGSGVIALAAGGGHTLVLRADGSVAGWGSSYFGEVGDGQAFVNRSSPRPVQGLGAGSGVVAVAAGSEHSLALRGDGSVLAWGGDRDGALGDGGAYVLAQPTPVPVSGLGPGSGVTAVAAGGWHSLAVSGRLGATFTPVSPARVWDSRFGPGPVGRLGPQGAREVTVTGIGGVPLSGVTAVVLNVTAASPSAGTFVTAWPSGEPRPFASNLNLPAGDTRPNVVTVKVGAGGRVSFYNDAGTTDLIADVAGWYGSPVGQRYTALAPARIWDGRHGPGPVGAVGPHQIRDVTVTGKGGVPATGVTAVVLNVTAVSPTAATFVTAWPAAEPRPLASNLNVPPGDTRANLVVVKVGAGGGISFYNDSGAVDLVADVAGYYTSSGTALSSVSPARVWDSRAGRGPVGRIGPGQTRDVRVIEFGGVPATGVTAVVLNVTAVAPTAATFVTAWPTGEPRPPTSNLNLPPGDTRPNLVVVKVGAGGQVSFSNDAGTVDLVADVAGWYGSPGS